MTDKDPPPVSTDDYGIALFGSGHVRIGIYVPNCSNSLSCN